MINKFIDSDAYQFLPKEVKKDGESTVLPLKTEGDGNCLPRAISRSMWGTEYWHGILRRAMAKEMEEHADFYKEYLGQYEIEGVISKFDVEDGEWEKVMTEANSDGVDGYLQGIHVFALSHVIRRPIILYCSDERRSKYGEGAAGVSGTYIPVRLKPEECASKIPVALAWSNEVLHHFVPLVGMENHLAPKWPLMPPAWLALADRINLYIDQPQNYRLKAEDNKLFLQMKEALKKAEDDGASEYQKFLQKMLADADDEEDEKRTHPETGEKFDHIISVKGKYYCGFNAGDDPASTAIKFFQAHPALARASDAEQVLKDLTKLMERVHSEREATLQRKLAGKQDGEATTTKGLCDCGFRHMYDGKEVDFVVAVPVPMRKLVIGWNYGDDVFDLVEKYVERHALPSEARKSIIQLLIMKEKNSLKMEVIKKELEKEEKAPLSVQCSKCFSYASMDRTDPSKACGKCSNVIENPSEAVYSKCVGCSNPFPFFSGQRFVKCPLCDVVQVVMECGKCKAQMSGLAVKLSGTLECPKCSARIITGLPQFVYRNQDALVPTRRLICYGDSNNFRKILDVLTNANSSPEIEGQAVCLSDMDLVNLQQLGGCIETDLQKSDFGASSAVVTEKMLLWPAKYRFAVLDFLRLMLLNRGYNSKVREEKSALVKAILKAGWEGDADWKCRFNALKCLCNLLCGYVETEHETEALSMMDDVVLVLDKTFGLENAKPLELVAAALITCDLSTLYAPGAKFSMDDSQNGTRDQLLTCLLTGLFPRALDILAKAVDSCHSYVNKSSVPPKECLTAIDKSNEVVVSLLQSLGNIYLGAPQKSLNELVLMYGLTQIVENLMAVDNLSSRVFGGQIPNTQKNLRSVFKDVMMNLN